MLHEINSVTFISYSRQDTLPERLRSRHRVIWCKVNLLPKKQERTVKYEGGVEYSASRTPRKGEKR